MTSGNDQREITDGKGVDDLIAHAVRRCGCCHLRGVQLDRGVNAENPGHDEHIDPGDGRRDHKDADGKRQQLSHALRIRNACDGAGNGEEDQRNQQDKQQVQPDLTDGVQDGRLFPQSDAQNGADHNKCDEDQRLAIGRFFSFHFLSA